MSIGDLILIVLTALLPATVTYLVVQLLKLNTVIDGLPGIVKQVVVVLIAGGLTALGGVLGIKVPGDIAGLADPATLTTVLAALEAWLIHKIFGTPTTPTASLGAQVPKMPPSALR
jgi:hypothetical protein